MIEIILVEPENSGNIGAIARIMANFDFKQLILINGIKIDEESQRRAMHGKDVLNNTKTKDFNHLKTYDYLIATTAKLGSDYNITRTTLAPETLAKKLSQLSNHANKKLKIGIVIGRESSGLTNEEIEMCDFTVSIPASKTYPTMNISHAVGIILYEIFKELGKSHTEHLTPMDAITKTHLLKLFDENLNQLTFETKEKKETQRKVFKQLITKSFLTRREAFSLMGFFKKNIGKR